MSKRTVFTTITPIPSGISRQSVLDMLHDHLAMIDLGPQIEERHETSPPKNATAEEFHCKWYSLTDKIQYLPGGVYSGKVSYFVCFQDLPDGLSTHCYAPLNLNIRSRWTVAGSLPGEIKQATELGLGIPKEGLYLREDIDMKCNYFLTKFVKGNLKKAHHVLVDRLVERAHIQETQESNRRIQENTTGSSTTTTTLLNAPAACDTLHSPALSSPGYPSSVVSPGYPPAQYARQSLPPPPGYASVPNNGYLPGSPGIASPGYPQGQFLPYPLGPDNVGLARHPSQISQYQQQGQHVYQDPYGPQIYPPGDEKKAVEIASSYQSLNNQNPYGQQYQQQQPPPAQQGYLPNDDKKAVEIDSDYGYIPYFPPSDAKGVSQQQNHQQVPGKTFTAELE